MLDASLRRCENPVRKGARICRGRRADVQRNPVRPEYRRREPLASGQSPRSPGTASIRRWSMAPTARSACTTSRAIEQSFLYDWTDGYMSEDMLKLNVWTPSLTGKRPVMVYYHGGGFTFGSAYELPSQDGAQLARHHDAVSVTVNHRLNLLGFLRPVRDRRTGLCRFGQRRDDRSGRVAAAGCARTSPISAAIPTPS